MTDKGLLAHVFNHDFDLIKSQDRGSEHRIRISEFFLGIYLFANKLIFEI